jgi:ABC-type multidrug transport system fused ATPase/permease subunit
VNYEAKIAALKEKGLFSKEQAERLSKSLGTSAEITPVSGKRHYWTELFGAVLLVGVLLYLFVAVGSSESLKGVEDISRSLNAPVDSGISAGQSMGVVVLLVAVVLYALFYLYVQSRYRSFWRMAEEIAVLQERIHHTEVMKRELGEKLEGLLAKEREPDGVLLSQSTRGYVMETLTEIDTTLLQLKGRLSQLETRCQKERDLFPANLAKLAGALPTC